MALRVKTLSAASNGRVLIWAKLSNTRAREGAFISRERKRWLSSRIGDLTFPSVKLVSAECIKVRITLGKMSIRMPFISDSILIFGFWLLSMTLNFSSFQEILECMWTASFNGRTSSFSTSWKWWSTKTSTSQPSLARPPPRTVSPIVWSKHFQKK